MVVAAARRPGLGSTGQGNLGGAGRLRNPQRSPGQSRESDLRQSTIQRARAVARSDAVSHSTSEEHPASADLWHARGASITSSVRVLWLGRRRSSPPYTYQPAMELDNRTWDWERPRAFGGLCWK